MNTHYFIKEEKTMQLIKFNPQQFIGLLLLLLNKTEFEVSLALNVFTNASLQLPVLELYGNFDYDDELTDTKSCNFMYLEVTDGKYGTPYSNFYISSDTVVFAEIMIDDKIELEKSDDILDYLVYNKRLDANIYLR